MNKIIFYIFYIIFICFLFKLNKPKTSTRYNSIKRGIFYIKKCLEGELIKPISQNISEFPKISVIIPVYNCEKIIKASIRSIQNQNMEEIEIILVNDNSTDNSPQIIKELSSEDSRVKIINNKNNKGTLYSRNIGILNSKGQYIMNLDNDDLFLNKEVFDTLYTEIEQGNYDIVGFAAAEGYTYKPMITQIYDNYFLNHKNGLILYQPELTYFPYTRKKKFRPNNYLVWGRIVRKDLYIKTINNLGVSAIGEDRKMQKIYWTEDSSISVVLFSLAKSYKYIKKYGIFHYLSRSTASNTLRYDDKLFGEIFFLDLLYDFTENNFIRKKYVVDKVKEMRYDKYYNIYNENNNKYLKGVLSKILNCEFISEKDKNNIKDLYKDLLNK